MKFLVASDLHCGSVDPSVLPRNEEKAIEMAKIQDVDFIVINGDMTDHGYCEAPPLNSLFSRMKWFRKRSPSPWTLPHVNEFQQFCDIYLSRLTMPVYMIMGNHDYPTDFFPLPFQKAGFYKFFRGNPVENKVIERHGGVFYSFTAGKLFFVMLGLYPNTFSLEYLASQPKQANTVLCFHYPLDGPFSDWWTDDEKTAFMRAIEDMNIVCIFHGHYHQSTHYEWKSIPVFCSGSSFLTGQIIDKSLIVSDDKTGWSVTCKLNDHCESPDLIA